MYLELVLCAVYSALYYYTSASQLSTISFATLFTGWIGVTILSVIIVYISGIFLFRFNIESDISWNFMSGFGFSYEADSVKGYLLTNLSRLIVLIICLGGMFIACSHSI